MKLILRYVGDFKKESVLAPLFKMLEALFELFVPLVIARMIDNGIENRNIQEIALCGLLLFALAIVGLAAAITAQYFSAKAAVGVSTKLRRDLFSAMQNYSFATIDKIGNATMITRITSDVNQVQNGINMTLRLLLRSPFIVFGAVIMSITIDVKSSMIFIITIPLLAIIIYGVMFVTMPLYNEAQTKLDVILNRTRENISGVRVIRAFSIEGNETNKFNYENEDLSSLQKRVGRIAALTNPLTFIVVNIATMCLLYYGGGSVYQGVLSRGQVIALVNYMSQILVELVKLANLIITITKALACAQRVEEVLDISGEMDHFDGASCRVADSYVKNDDVASKIIFKNVSMSYDNSSRVLDNISFEASAGEVIGIIGGTGSGKSTLVNLIPRFYDISAGSIEIDGKDIRDIPIEVLRRSVGIAMQKAVLFSGTIADNLRWGCEAGFDEMKKALTMAQAWEFVSEKEGNVEYILTSGGKNLSGGQRQRISIARALIRKPKILILDDSSSALDYATDLALRKSIEELKKDGFSNGVRPIVFIVSQRTASLSYADKILLLEDGKIIDMGTHQELLDRSDVYREIHESQYKNVAD